MRLINADALIPMMKYATIDNEIGVFPIRIGFDAIKRVIDDASTIDAVEVIRCKDCIYADFKSPYPVCNLIEMNITDNDYCSWGERSEP